MYIILVKNKIKQEKKMDYIYASRLFAKDMLQVDGCTHAYVLESLDEEDVVVNVEIWESKSIYEAYDGHIFLNHKETLKPNFISNTIEHYSI